MPQRGIEPHSLAFRASIITTRPPRHLSSLRRDSSIVRKDNNNEKKTRLGPLAKDYYVHWENMHYRKYSLYGLLQGQLQIIANFCTR